MRNNRMRATVTIKVIRENRERESDHINFGVRNYTQKKDNNRWQGKRFLEFDGWD